MANVQYVNPPGMHANPAYTQAIVIPAGARLMLIGGQNGVGPDGEIVAKGDLGRQSAQALDNLIACLAAAGAGLEHLVKLTIYIAHGHDIRPGFAAWMARWGDRRNPPVITGVTVPGFARPDFLVEIEAIAVLP